MVTITGRGDNPIYTPNFCATSVIFHKILWQPWLPRPNLVLDIRSTLLHLFRCPNATFSNLHEDTTFSKEVDGTTNKIIMTCQQYVCHLKDRMEQPSSGQREITMSKHLKSGHVDFMHRIQHVDFFWKQLNFVNFCKALRTDGKTNLTIWFFQWLPKKNQLRWILWF